MAFSDQATLAETPAFIKRVRLALCKAAVAVCSEAYGGVGQPSAAQHNLRAAWATQVLRNPEIPAVWYAWGVVTNGAITAESIDSDIEFTVNGMFDAYAGTVPVS